MNGFSEKVNFIWSIADLLRGDYKQSEYGRVILPFTVLRRLDCVLEETKEDVLAKKKELEDMGIKNLDPILNKTAGYNFHNRSRFDFKKLLDDPNNIKSNLMNYIHGFSKNAREILEYFNFEVHIERLNDADLLYLIVQRFSEVDIHPDTVSNKQMGDIFEELIRKFSEQSNETAGEHFTPREVIKLMVNILFEEDNDLLQKEGIVRTIYDPACGTGGMLTVAENYLSKLNPDATLKMFGQELNPESYAICKADMLIKGEPVNNIKYGNSFTNDKLRNNKFDYMLSNPPFGVSWKKIRDEVEKEADELGYDGRFGAGLPRVNDGSLLFLQHMISKMKSNGQGSRIAIVFNASPLFNGGAGSGESEIRRWIIENDWLEAIIGLPEELFYNTGINTYIWIVTNRKTKEREGKVQLINAVDYYEEMRQSKGNKRNFISEAQIDEITRIYGEFEETDNSKIFQNEEFGYQRITVEQPIRRCYQVNEERIEAFKEKEGFERIGERKNGEEMQEQILQGLRDEFDFDNVYKNHGDFIADIEEVFSDVSIRLYKYIRTALFNAFGWEDERAEPAKDKDGEPIPDPDLREKENVPLTEDINDYFSREIEPHLEDAWVDYSKTKIGYEIPFTRYFYEYEELRSLEEIDNDIDELKDEILDLLEEVTG
ncbi:type I restriction-modification system subunit M [Halarsenatibacter silvermanii]|uniref:site-specific DNA-methyltransferase (adenine-specific) n=1 Tax=Halarsenatibacter silvermanii TaxID=321763 RepID=A0A1G9KTN9_9FIRM|nr:class I SAM-dependent DNA methyltransferase [Halarsenatibacter silvermanii]SDL52996.1 type I restriction enzyme M protein [Halarsenatibacter silvermanii]